MSIGGGAGGGSGGTIYVQGIAVPTELWNMMNTASVDQGVALPILVRIWKWESGGAFPNMAVNSSGYGGLFGLGNNQYYFGIGPIQDLSDNEDDELNQCEAAAAEIHYLTNVNGGSLYNAMLAYDGGSTVEASFVAAAVSGGNGMSTPPAPGVETVAAVQAQQNVPSSIPPKSSLAFDGFRVAFANIIPSIVSDYNAIRTTWNHGGGGVPGGAPNR